MPGTNCENTNDGEKDTEHCHDIMCPSATASTGLISVSMLVALIVAMILIAIVSFKARHLIVSRLRGTRSNNHRAPRVKFSPKKNEALEISSFRQGREPIAVTDFRRLMRDRKIPSEDEYQRLGTVDARLNRQNKSKEAGLAANKEMDSPRNRYEFKRSVLYSMFAN